MAEWIKTKDRMPDVGEHVLVFGIWRTQTVGYLKSVIRDRQDTGGRYWHVAHNTHKGCNWPLDGVTHWMPLPEPPKEQQ